MHQSKLLGVDIALNLFGEEIEVCPYLTLPMVTTQDDELESCKLQK